MLALKKLTSKQYNPKIDIRFIYYISEKFDWSYSETLKSDGQFRKVFQQYLKFRDSELTIKAISEMLSALGNAEPCSDEQFNRIIFIENDCGANDFFKIFQLVIQENLFGDYSREMAKILFNRLITTNGYMPVVFYSHHSNYILSAIYSNNIEFAIIGLNQLVEYVDYHFNSIDKNRQTNLDVITARLLDNKDSLQNIFGVTQLGLFGSYVSKTFNEYSDLDVWFKTSKELTINQFVSLKKTLESILDSRVDLAFWQDELKDSVMRERLTIYDVE